MALGLYTLLEAMLLFVNAVAVLNRERFLRKFGIIGDGTGLGGQSTFGNFVQSVQMVMRLPLIGINSAVILLKLFIG